LKNKFFASQGGAEIQNQAAGFGPRLNLKPNTQRIERVFVPREHNAGHNHSSKLGNKLFETCDKVQMFGNDTNEIKMAYNEEVKIHSKCGECQCVLRMTQLFCTKVKER